MSLIEKLSKIPFISRETETAEYFFVVNISETEVEGAVWGIEGKKIRIVSSSTQQYTSHQDLIEAANFALDEALADFQPEPEKVLFGVPESWLQDEDLKNEYLKLLRGLVKELEISPMAFVSTSHAICHLLQKQQGVPVTAVLVQIADPLIVTVVKAGKVLGSQEQKRSANLPEDIEKALLSFTDVEVLPSKILIYGRDIYKYKEELLSFAWMAQLPFLHLPKIDELGEGVALKAVCFAGASELHPDMDLSPEIVTKSAPPGLSKPLTMKDDLEDVGFVAGDIERAVAPRKPAEYEVEDFERPLEQVKGKISGFFSNLHLKLPGGAGRGKSLIAPVLILIILVAAAIFLPKATVTMFIDLRTMEKEAQVIADPAVTAVDEAGKKIPGKVLEVEETGTAKGTASGKKQVGDPAKGSVIVYNKTSAPKTFSQGTVLVGPSSLTFTLDTSVTVASQSAVEGGISFGKGTANVTASEIGPDSNLAAGKELSVKGQSSSDFSAKVDQALSGGVSKEVTVVTSDDQKKLLASLTSELRKKAKDDIQGKLSGDAKVLEAGLAEQVLKSSYSKNVNDQASEFSLTVTARYKGTSYSDADLKAIVSKLVETTAPEGYELDWSKTETQADVSKIEKDGKLVFAAKFRAKLMPKFDREQIKKDLVFKTPESAAEKLKAIENVIGSSIELKPSLPGPLQRLPVLARNITLEVTAK